MLSTVPLNKLLISARNVRKTNPDEDIESLADDIAASGLKQNLVVTESHEKKGFYDVDAGGRRFRALQLLAKRGDLAKNFPVPVLVEPHDRALETSLSENLHRVAMNPADEFVAFGEILARYEDSGIADLAERIANCARRFGVTPRYVQQRLRLSALAPEILQALREGRISLDAAKAYAAYSDPDLQLKTFKEEEKKGNWGHSPQAIKGAMSGKVYRASDPRVLYVGADAYLAAGGRIEPELFMSADDQDVFLDTKVIDALVKERAGAEAARLGQDSGFFDGAFDPNIYGSFSPPAAPEGYKVHYGYLGVIADDQRGEAIALCRLNAAGELELSTSCYVKKLEQPAPAAAPTQPHVSWQERERLQQIELKAAILAAPRVAGTPLEGRAFWPSFSDHYIEAVQDAGDEHVFVALLVKVSRAELEAQKAEAERLYIEEQERRKAAEEAAEQAGQTCGEPVDIDDSDEPEVELAA